jgi:hypothetical protein
LPIQRNTLIKNPLILNLKNQQNHLFLNFLSNAS